MQLGPVRLLNVLLVVGIVGLVSCILGFVWLESDIPIAVAGVCAVVMLLLVVHLKSRMLLP